VSAATIASSPLALVRHVAPDACKDALAWLGTIATTPIALAYRDCPRADWLLWLAGRLGVERIRIVLAACACAELALPIYEARYPGDARPRRCIDVTRAWCRGEATLEDVREARQDAYADAAAAAAAADADAAYAAARAAASSARDEMRRRCAAAVRREIPWPIVASALVRRMGS